MERYLKYSAEEKWIKNYEVLGTDAFSMYQNKCYLKTEKEQAVAAYLSGEGSVMDICKKCKILSICQLRSWIKKSNGYEELKSSGIGEALIMMKGRKTTLEEQVEIASYCIFLGVYQ